MSTPDLSTITEELAALRARLDEQDAELHDLRSAAGEPEVPRRHLLRNLAGLGAAGLAGLVATADPASAADGDPLVLGSDNTSSTPTTVAFTDGATGRTAEARLCDPWWGVAGIASDGAGVIGYIADAGYAGVHGQVDQPMGVGVLAEAQQLGSIALGAQSISGPTVWAKSDDGVTLRLEPATRTGPPTNVPAGLSSYLAGEFSVDNAGDLWVCIQDGTPGTWTRLLREDTAPGRVVPITPIRALDTRAPGGRAPGAPTIPGQTQGPLTGGSTTTLDPAGTGGIPPTATGIVGNVTAVTPNYNGYLTIAPAGATTDTSTLNYPAGTAALANAFTTQLTPTGLTIRPAGTPTNAVHVIIDITAYIT